MNKNLGLETLEAKINNLINTTKLKKEINLYVLVDPHGYICYTGHSEQAVKDYKESNCFNDKLIVKLTGYLPQGEK